MNKVKKWVPATIPIRANLAAWKTICQDIHDNLIDAGLVQTADTGQIADFEEVEVYPAINTWPYYRIYRFDDALQSTSPVFIRLNFGAGVEGLGSSNNTRSNDEISIQILAGTGSDGAGVLENASDIITCPQLATGVSGGGNANKLNTTYGTSYYSRNDDIGLFAFFYGVGSRNKPFASANGSYHGATLSFVIQRLTDSQGIPQAGGFALLGPRISATSSINWETGLQTANTMQVQYISNISGPGALSRAGAVRFLGDIEINHGENVHFTPISYYNHHDHVVRQCAGVACYPTNSLAEGSEFDLALQPLTERNFVALGNETCMIPDNTSGQRGALAIVFEED